MIKIFKKKKQDDSESPIVPENEAVETKNVKGYTKEIFLELKPTQDVAIQKIIESHLLLLDSLDDYSLYLPCVDQVLQNLQYGLDSAADENQKKLLKKESTIIISSLLLKLQAQFLAFKKSSRAEAQELLKFSDKQYVTAVLNTLASVSFSKEILRQSVNDLKLTMSEQSETGTESFFVFNSMKLFTKYKRKRSQYYKTFNEMFEKFYRNRNLLGDSLVLSEFIYNHEKDLTNYYVRGKKLRSHFWKIFTVLVIFFGTIALIDYFLISSVVNLFAESETESSSFAFKEMVILGIAISPVVYYKIKYWIMGYRIRKKYHEIADALSPNRN